MVDVKGFKQWLSDNTIYSSAVISDMASRMRRADKMLEWSNEDVYLFKLEQLDEYRVISVSVRSQIKKAVKLYSQYTKDNENKQIKELEF